MLFRSTSLPRAHGGVSQVVGRCGDFVRSQWERVERARDHLHSTIRNDYGFIENYNVGHGWVEFGPLAGSDVEV